MYGKIFQKLTDLLSCMEKEEVDMWYTVLCLKIFNSTVQRMAVVALILASIKSIKKHYLLKWENYN